MARAGGGARDVLYGRVPEDAVPQAAGARYMRTLERHQPPGGQNRCLVLPQEQVQRRTVEQIVDLVFQCSKCLCRRW